MDKPEIYTLNDKSHSVVDKDIETMDEWLKSLNDDELTDWHRICNQDMNDMSDDEIDLVVKYSVVLYYRELNVEELSINDDLLLNISSRFSVNVIVESLRRRGLAEPKEPLLLYKDTKIDLTDKGQKFHDENLK